MADSVQYKLERMLDEVEDLDRREIFTPREIAEIVKQRRKFEYRIKRPSPLKQDFIAYIDYEKQLDRLRMLRKKTSAREHGVKKLGKSKADYAGVTRIIEIYRLATTRFKGDVDLWFQYLEFCRLRRANGRMKKALADLVRYHPKEPGVWIYAATWEFDTNLNVAAGRALMQNGLRACPASEDLWVEYLRLELTYLNKLAARKIALGEGVGGLARNRRNINEEQWRDENKELFMAFNPEADADEGSVVRYGESEGRVDTIREQGANIFQAIYAGAIEAVPTSFGLRRQFLDILDGTNLAHADNMRRTILDDMKRDFSEDPMYWDWLARAEKDAPEGIYPKKLGKAIQVYEEGLECVPSTTMVELYVKFLMEAINDGNKDEQIAVHFQSQGHEVELIPYILMVFEKAEKTGSISEDLACEHVSFLMELGKIDDAKLLVEKLCSGQFSDAVHLWTLRLSMEMKYAQNKSLPPSEINQQHIFKPLRTVLTKLSISVAESLWIMGLKYFVNQRHYFDKLVETSFSSLAEHGGSDNGFSLASTIVNIILQRDGIDNARVIYKRYLALPRPGLTLYRDCIEIETNLASVGDKNGLKNARKLYESALATYDQDASLWQAYYSMEVKMGTSETAAAVHWRARKTVKSNLILHQTN